MPRTIAIGRSFDPGLGQVDLVILPGDPIPPARPGLTVHHGPGLEQIMRSMRGAFASHRSIASLGGAEVLGTHPWREPIETRLCEFLEDLGNTSIDSLDGAVNAIRNGQHLVSGSTSAGLAGALRGFPAICIGAGPSATPKALAQIAELQTTHYIFACDAMTHACAKAGIIPHFVTLLERVVEMHPLVKGAHPDSILLAMPVAHPDCVAEFTKHCWFFGGDDLYPWLAPNIPVSFCGRS